MSPRYELCRGDTVQAIGSYKNGYRHGKWTFVNSERMVIAKGRYYNGEMKGVWRHFSRIYGKESGRYFTLRPFTEIHDSLYYSVNQRHEIGQRFRVVPLQKLDTVSMSESDKIFIQMDDDIWGVGPSPMQSYPINDTIIKIYAGESYKIGNWIKRSNDQQIENREYEIPEYYYRIKNRSWSYSKRCLDYINLYSSSTKEAN